VGISSETTIEFVYSLFQKELIAPVNTCGISCILACSKHAGSHLARLKHGVSTPFKFPNKRTASIELTGIISELSNFVSNQPSSATGASEGNTTTTVLADSSIQPMVQLFKLVSDGTRLRILFLLGREKEINVRTLCGLLQQSQPAVSHHLGLLRVAGLIACRRDGKHNYYYLVTETLADLIDLLCQEAIGKTGTFLLPSYQVSSRDH